MHDGDAAAREEARLMRSFERADRGESQRRKPVNLPKQQSDTNLYSQASGSGSGSFRSTAPRASAPGAGRIPKQTSPTSSTTSAAPAPVTRSQSHSGGLGTRDSAPVFSVVATSGSSEEADWDRRVQSARQQHKMKSRQWDLETYLKTGQLPEAIEGEEGQRQGRTVYETVYETVEVVVPTYEVVRSPSVRKKAPPKQEIPKEEAEKDLDKLLGIKFEPKPEEKSTTTNSALAELDSLAATYAQPPPTTLPTSFSAAGASDFKDIEASLNSLNFLIDDLASSSDSIASQREKEQKELEAQRLIEKQKQDEAKQREYDSLMAERAELEQAVKRMEAERASGASAAFKSAQFTSGPQDRRSLEQARENAKSDIGRAIKQALSTMDSLIAGGSGSGLVEAFRQVEDALRPALHPSLVPPTAYLTAVGAAHEIIRLAAAMLGVAARSGSGSRSSHDVQELENYKGSIRAKLVTLLKEVTNTPLTSAVDVSVLSTPAPSYDSYSVDNSASEDALLEFRQASSKVGTEAVALLNAPVLDVVAFGKLLTTMAQNTTKAHQHIAKCTQTSQRTFASATEKVAEAGGRLISGDGGLAVKSSAMQAFAAWLSAVSALSLA